MTNQVTYTATGIMRGILIVLAFLFVIFVAILLLIPVPEPTPEKKAAAIEAVKLSEAQERLRNYNNEIDSSYKAIAKCKAHHRERYKKIDDTGLERANYDESEGVWKAAINSTSGGIELCHVTRRGKVVKSS